MDYGFRCDQWLDTGVGDGLIKRTLDLTGKGVFFLKKIQVEIIESLISHVNLQHASFLAITSYVGINSKFKNKKSFS